MRTAILATALLTGAAVHGVAQQVDLSRYLTIEYSSFDPSTLVANMDLANSGTKTITAYEIQLGAGFDSPFIEEFFVSVGLESAFLATASRQQQNFPGGIRSGETRSITRGELPTKGPGRIFSPKVTAVVFADRTAVGDEAQIKDIFSQRAGEAAEWGKWAQRLKPDVFRKMDRAGAKIEIKRLRSEMSSPLSERPLGKADEGAQMARGTLGNLLEQAQRSDDPQWILAHIAERASALAEQSNRNPGVNR